MPSEPNKSLCRQISDRPFQVVGCGFGGAPHWVAPKLLESNQRSAMTEPPTILGAMDRFSAWLHDRPSLTTAPQCHSGGGNSSSERCRKRSFRGLIYLPVQYASWAWPTATRQPI